MSSALAEARLHAVRVAAKASLLNITLVDVSARLEDGLSPADEGLQPEFEIESGYARDGVNLQFRVDYVVTVRHGAQVAATIRCSFAAHYELPEDFEAEGYEFEAYGMVTVIFALHPYLRELVQSMTARLSLPPVTLDVIKLPAPPPPPPPAKASAKAKAASGAVRDAGAAQPGRDT